MGSEGHATGNPDGQNGTSGAADVGCTSVSWSPDAWRDHSHTRGLPRREGDRILRPAWRLDSNRLGVRGPDDLQTHPPPGSIQSRKGVMGADGGSLRLAGGAVDRRE
jgi:hypothetical protein